MGREKPHQIKDIAEMDFKHLSDYWGAGCISVAMSLRNVLSGEEMDYV